MIGFRFSDERPHQANPFLHMVCLYLFIASVPCAFFQPYLQGIRFDFYQTITVMRSDSEGSGALSQRLMWR